VTTAEGSISIPRSHYRDESILEQELQKIYGETWVFIGHESEIPAPGDYVTRSMGANPVVMSRTQDGGIHVMLNSCTHRGTEVCKLAYGNTTTFRCGYHGWVFGADGALKGVPGRRALYGPGFDPKRLGLRKARVETMCGLVFATWQHDGESLEENLGDFAWYLKAFFEVFPGGMEVYGGVHNVDVRGNWKIHIENFAGDGYHLQNAHRTMFELGVMGNQAGTVEGFVVNEPHGHSLRAQYLTDEGTPDVVLGYEDDLLSGVEGHLDKEQQKFRERTTVIHGLVYPNLLLITTSPLYFGEDACGAVAFTQLRSITPIDAHHHRVTYWSLVPRDASDEWKAKSYLYSTRQHGAASYFEADDLENFRRIDAGMGDAVGGTEPFNYDLGIDVAEKCTPPWEGPGTIVRQDLTEANQRNLVRRYLEQMGTEA
jgi:phenylpropionate dioxygenase-like ring-hydroxylating dioxygenase large terminal subunit